MQKFVYDDEFKLFSTDKLSKFNQAFIKHTEACLIEYRDFFDTDDLQISDMEIYLFDDLEKYREDYRKRLGKEPPEYSRGNFGQRKAYIMIDSKELNDDTYLNKAKAIGAHEIFHVLYRELGYKSGERIVWFDEGLAQVLSKEKDFLTEDKLRKYFLKTMSEYKDIDNLNERIQGNSSIPDDKIFTRKGVIDGYALSYFSVRFLLETKGREYLKRLMKENNTVIEVGQNILPNMIRHYSEKFKETEHEIDV